MPVKGTGSGGNTQFPGEANRLPQQGLMSQMDPVKHSQGHNPAAVAQLRAKNPDGSWGPWYEAESTDGKGESVTGTGGTEPVYLGLDTTAVQISLSGIDLDDTSLAGAPEVTPDEPAPTDTRPADAPRADEAEAPADEA